MALNEDERKSISHLHGMPANHRDASGVVWKNKNPTPINLPSNHNIRRERTGAGSSLYTRSNMRNPQHTSNKTAKQTLTSSSPPHYGRPSLGPSAPPAKRRKVQDGYVTAKGTPSHYFPAINQPEVINIAEDEDEDDDLGVTVTRSVNHPSTPDQIDFLNRQPSKKAAGKRRALPVIPVDPDDDHPPSARALSKRDTAPIGFRIHHEDDEMTEVASSSSTLRGSRPVKDGDATRALAADVDSDPIEEYPPSPIMTTEPQTNVKFLTKKFEDMSEEKPRKIDLRVENKNAEEKKKKKESIKGSMKGKKGANPPKQLAYDPLMESTHFTGHTGRLRIEKWYYGTEFREDPECFLTWSKDKMTLLGDKKRICEFELVKELSSVTCPEDPPFVVKLETIAVNTSTSSSRNLTDFEMGGTRFRGEVVIWIDDEREGAVADYASFLRWLKARKQRVRTTRGPAGFQVWNAAERAAELAAQQRSRQNLQAPEIPSKTYPRTSISLEEEEFSPPPPNKLLRDTINVNTFAPSRPPSRTSDLEVRRSARNKPRTPSLDPEEVILCYPSGIPGAVYIKNSDYKRLDPGEYLNDTLIEFGLKLWHTRLQESQPELASQIHVFSSFFYKKLNNKDADQGYESVRKWTAKIDIFSKKYIIIPINENFHWYLVIIYHPEHVLNPPLPNVVSSPTTRGRKKATDITPLGSVLESVFARKPSPPSTTDNAGSSKPSTSISTSATTPPSPTLSISSMFPNHQPTEVEEEQAVSKNLLHLDPSCTVDIIPMDFDTARATSDPELVVDNPAAVSDSPLTPTEKAESPMDVEDREASPTVSDYLGNALPAPSLDQYDVDMENSGLLSSSLPETAQYGPRASPEINTAFAPIEPTRFYGRSGKAIGKQKAIPNQVVHRQGDHPGPILNSPGVVEEMSARTFIFTFDSLGSKHPQAIKVLNRYLKKEAQDKLKLENIGNGVGKQAQVPVQPNFCDCGLYLLHFAETFISDPVKYCQIIMHRTKGTTNTARVEDWKGERADGMREQLREEIVAMSNEWKAAKQKEVAVGPSIETIESSDDDIDILETTPATAPVKAAKKSGNRN